MNIPFDFCWITPDDHSSPVQNPTLRNDSQQKQQSREIKKLYQAYMPWAKPKGREKLAIVTINGLDNEDTDQPDSNDKRIIAVVRIRPIGEFELVTGMLVHPEYRGQGIGDELLKFISPELTSGKSFLYALPHLENYYSRAGFQLRAIDTVPNDIGQLYLKYSRQKPLVLMGWKG
ncbi:GNAT family N-acetyltransferase [Shewanella submarina]|uniref:GNAT family N-acetyltransferase n=1 Tax=Shewanella submarina TaxID=2016376 RepID=A0ABV7GG52_9GAMM|nr:GNAT family N-acetyltransferase [Shewanella submarina]MCL1038078.1 GNAT family N-acetyltransferase [Shewanella submarina]